MPLLEILEPMPYYRVNNNHCCHHHHYHQHHYHHHHYHHRQGLSTAQPNHLHANEKTQLRLPPGSRYCPPRPRTKPFRADATLFFLFLFLFFFCLFNLTRGTGSVLASPPRCYFRSIDCSRLSAKTPWGCISLRGCRCVCTQMEGGSNAVDSACKSVLACP